MNNIKYCRFFSVLIFLTITVHGVANATIREYIRDYDYHVTDYDTRFTARVSAIDGLKHSVLNEIGTFVSDVIKINKDDLGNTYMSKDTTQITAGIISLNILEEDWDKTIYSIKGKLMADDEEVLRFVKQLGQDEKLEQALRESMDELNELRSQIKNLKSQLQSLGDTNAATAEGLKENYLEAVKQVDVELRMQDAIIAYIDGYFGEMILTLTELADAGYAKAMSRLGYTYEKGLGVRVDYNKATNWYQKAIANGSDRAMARLGFLYERGLGVKQNTEKAVDLYSKAIEAGNDFAKARLGQMYMDGDQIKRDDEMAYKLFLAAAEHNNGKAFTNLGMMYEKGRYVDPDLDKAVAYYQKGADRGNPHAMALLGNLYRTGKGVEKDTLKAYKLIQAGADRGNAYAIARLGQLYEKGQGLPKSEKEAFERYQQSAMLGSTFGFYMLGRAYEEEIGVDGDDDLAVQWYAKAAARGHSKAKDRLSDLQ